MSRDDLTDRRDRIDIAAVKVHETEQAFLLNIGNVDDEGVPAPSWFPKSQCEENGDGTFSMPEWLAIKRGAI